MVPKIVESVPQVRLTFGVASVLDRVCCGCGEIAGCGTNIQCHYATMYVFSRKKPTNGSESTMGNGVVPSSLYTPGI